jgi:hypothetical protein
MKSECVPAAAGNGPVAQNHREKQSRTIFLPLPFRRARILSSNQLGREIATNRCIVKTLINLKRFIPHDT